MFQVRITHVLLSLTVSDEIKWQLRFPTKFAMSDLKLTYLDKVKEETEKFVQARIKHNFIRPDQALSLDLTVGDAELLISANQDVKDLAERGELVKIHSKFDELQKRIDGDYLATRNNISKVLYQIEEKENALYVQLEELGVEKLQKHGEKSILDIFGLSNGDASFSNLTLVEAAILKGHGASDQLSQIQNKLQTYIGIKARYYEIKVELREEFVKKVSKNDVAAIDELKALVTLRDQYQNAYSRYQTDDAEYQIYINKLGEIVNRELRKIINDFTEYEKAYNERERVYHSYMKDQDSESLSQFRNELLQHLAGSIIVKEHRQRYQKEQFDRFLISLYFIKLKGKNLSLNDFAKNYAYMIESLIEDSHNNSCPKVEANYDDYQERTVRPINATIFYYFFQGSAASKTMAQWLLAAARYPNQRVRRAYTRFFV